MEKKTGEQEFLKGLKSIQNPALASKFEPFWINYAAKTLRNDAILLKLWFLPQKVQRSAKAKNVNSLNTTSTHCTPLDLGCYGRGLFGSGSWIATSSWWYYKSRGGCCWRCRRSRRWSHSMTGTGGRRSNAASRSKEKYHFHWKRRENRKGNESWQREKG